MDRTACTEPQCLYRASVPVQECTLPYLRRRQNTFNRLVWTALLLDCPAVVFKEAHIHLTNDALPMIRYTLTASCDFLQLYFTSNLLLGWPFCMPLPRETVSMMNEPQTAGSAKHEIILGRLALQLRTTTYRGIATPLSNHLVILRALFKRDIWQFGAESVPRDIPVLSCGMSSLSGS